MKFTVNVNANLEDISLERLSDGSINLTLNDGSEGVNMSVAEFKELRKAVGYVWTEVEQNA